MVSGYWIECQCNFFSLVQMACQLSDVKKLILNLLNYYPWITRMTSSNENIFCVTGPLCGEFTSHWWIPLTKASDTELWSAPWINGWVNNGEAGDLRRYHAHYDVIVMAMAEDHFTCLSWMKKFESNFWISSLGKSELFQPMREDITYAISLIGWNHSHLTQDNREKIDPEFWQGFLWNIILPGGYFTDKRSAKPALGLTHWGRVTHICVSDLTSIGSDNGLSPGRRQAII